MDSLKTTEEPWERGKTAAFRWFVVFSLAFIAPLEPLTNLAIPWIGSALLGIEREIVVEMTGSGDTTAEYLRLLLHVVAASLGTLLWTALADSRVRYRKGLHWFAFALRLAVAISMLSYGVSKLGEGQFRSPSDIQLFQSYGNASPMGLLWTFMGHSKVYSAFGGMGEVLGGLLLLSRRTTTLGALVVAGVMTNVVMLNFCYDVPVKLYSSRLLLWALFLAGLDRHRLYALFANTGETQPQILPRLYAKRRAHLAGLVAKVLAAAFLGGSMLIAPYFMQPKPSPTVAMLAGTYEVVTVQHDDALVPPLVTDNERWHRVVIRDLGDLVVFGTNGERSFYGAEFDPEAEMVELTRRAAEEDEPDVRSWNYAFDPTAETLVLHDGRNRIELKVFEPEFLLRDRGFHWIQERPFNR